MACGVCLVAGQLFDFEGHWRPWSPYSYNHFQLFVGFLDLLELCKGVDHDPLIMNTWQDWVESRSWWISWTAGVVLHGMKFYFDFPQSCYNPRPRSGLKWCYSIILAPVETDLHFSWQHLARFQSSMSLRCICTHPLSHWHTQSCL